MGAAYATIGSKIYIAGGGSGHPQYCPGTVSYNSLWVFDPHGRGAPGSWTQKADMPVAGGGAASCEVDGILYAAGGVTSIGGNPVQTLYAYDLASGLWTRKADMPTKRALAVACAVDGIVYVIGGGNASTLVMTKAVEAYDPKTDTWTVKADMPSARGDMAACAVNGLIYVIGGASSSTGFLAVVQCYDPKTDQWTEKTPLPVTSVGAAAQAVNSIIYVFSGRQTYAYDPATDLWTYKASITAAGFYVDGSAAGTVDGLVYLFGGRGIGSPYCAHTLTLAYDPIQDQFAARRAMPEPCLAAAYATIGGRIYIAGGGSGPPSLCPGAVIYNSLRVFDPEGGVAPYILSFTRQSDETVRLVWQGEAGRLYGVESASTLTYPFWAPITLSNGNTTIRATKSVVEATGTVAPPHQARFFRVSEAD